MNQKENSLDSKTELIREVVQHRIDYGEYVVAFDMNSKSSAYKFIMRVFKGHGGAVVPNWFYCPFCTGLLEQNVSIGTTPLLRHVEKLCPEVPELTREELKVLRNQKPKTSTKLTQKIKSKHQPSHSQTTVTKITPNVDMIVSLPSVPNQSSTQTSADNRIASLSQPSNTQATPINVN